mmetsp:Transcript_42931/g.75600  ORF Transcript_42931/g.75600 Transcript_42931/m.75600 type:complete len:252 (-) Transcript_42931:44-799(-)
MTNACVAPPPSSFVRPKEPRCLLLRMLFARPFTCDHSAQTGKAAAAGKAMVGYAWLYTSTRKAASRAVGSMSSMIGASMDRSPQRPGGAVGSFVSLIVPTPAGAAALLRAASSRRARSSRMSNGRAAAAEGRRGGARDGWAARGSPAGSTTASAEPRRTRVGEESTAAPHALGGMRASYDVAARERMSYLHEEQGVLPLAGSRRSAEARMGGAGAGGWHAGELARGGAEAGRDLRGGSSALLLALCTGRVK